METQWDTYQKIAYGGKSYASFMAQYSYDTIEIWGILTEKESHR